MSRARCAAVVACEAPDGTCDARRYGACGLFDAVGVSADARDYVLTMRPMPALINTLRRLAEPCACAPRPCACDDAARELSAACVLACALRLGLSIGDEEIREPDEVDVVMAACAARWASPRMAKMATSLLQIQCATLEGSADLCRAGAPARLLAWSQDDAVTTHVRPL